MTNKLIVDFSPLWIYPEGIQQFIIRYSDINETRQTSLASSIKKKARQWKLTEPNGPTIGQIKELLALINPIIFAERGRNQDYRDWNKSNAQDLSGWRFEKLCQVLYSLLCVKKQRRSSRFETILDAMKTSLYGVDKRALPGEGYEGLLANTIEPVAVWEETANTQRDTTEVSVEEVQQARERQEENAGRRQGADRIRQEADRLINGMYTAALHTQIMLDNNAPQGIRIEPTRDHPEPRF